MGCDLEKNLPLEKITTESNKQAQKKCCRMLTSPTKSARQPDSPYAYLVCFCGVLCNLIMFGCSYSYGLIFPSLLDEFKEGKAKTAWVGSLAYGSSGIFGPVVGVLSDRFDPRIIAIIGGFISTIGLIVTSQAPNLTLMYFSYGILYGFGSSCVFFVVLIILQRYFIKSRSLVTGLAVTGPGAGLFVMGPIIQALLNNTSWRMTFMSMAGIVFLTCIMSCSFDPNVDIDNESSDHQKTQARKMHRLNRCASLDFSYLRNKEYVVYLVACSVAFSGNAIPIVHLGRYCQEIGIDANHVAQMFFFNGLASAIFRAVTGRLCDIRKDCPVWIMRLTLFVSGTMVILMTLWSSFKQLLAWFVVYGMTDGAFASSMNVLVLSTLSPQQKSQGIGFFHLCLSCMVVAGPPFGGLIADLFGSYNPAFYLAASAQILAVVILFLTNCDKHGDTIVVKDFHVEKLLIVDKITVL
ncbi:monocarboxylate transporter 10-like [Oculina patagonica]